ncbi:MAG: flagellar motor protein [Rhodocyclaceae bacterium]|nr:flagellar motor protein [Rhodocyclaceae bacterium]
MKKFDNASFFGLLIGLAAIVGGQVLEGGSVASLLQPTAFVIVVGGTLGAVMLQSPLPIFLTGLRMVSWVFSAPVRNDRAIIDAVVSWSTIARREGLLALENRLGGIRDPFMHKGVQLIVDGIEPERIREVLHIEIDTSKNHLRTCARIWESAAGYAPTIGILGAVMGLIHVMENLSDPTLLGAGIAVAFVATIYGVGSANLIFLPIDKKLVIHNNNLSAQREMLVEGLLGIACGENPRVIEGRMRAHTAGVPSRGV